jgi:ferredoxin
MALLQELVSKFLSAPVAEGLEAKRIVIGYEQGTSCKVRPLIAQTKEESAKIIFDAATCTGNLAAYLYKSDVKKLGKAAIVANIPTLRSIIRLAVEHQLKDGDFVVFATKGDGNFEELETLAAVEAFLDGKMQEQNEKDAETLAKLEQMTLQQRWDFWQEELKKCIKCYACRQACPMCYCNQCTVEDNRPQWIPVAAHRLGNLEWHLMRAMHLVGRCVSCRQCGTACPVNIPIHLLPMKLAIDVKNIYGTNAGMKLQEESTLSTYQPDDKENFIG